MYKSVNDIRQEFLNFFQKKEHQIVSGSSLIPQNDQTLLFTNSGMNQFKNIFLGIEKPLFKRVATVQNCIRVGGKHNDLDNVGYTDRHLTFFEMLGNFSFGDYFKNDAIQFAWELLTDRNWFNLSKDRIWVTTHICDNESYDIWRNHIGVSKKHLVKIGSETNNFCDSDNFWKMGNVGPCGPCSEIFYDRGDDFDGAPPGINVTFGERYLEIWNLVFIQFNRHVDGCLSSLPMLSVDTGMGLERIASILQRVRNNYLIDIFKNLISAISKIIKIKDSIMNRSIYVLADHIRSCVFLIKDGVIPSNEGRGYVLRRIIRRAVRHGKKLGIKGIFLYKLIDPVMTYMKCLNNILNDQRDLMAQVLFNEEKLFENTLQKGLALLNAELIQLKQNTVLSGKVAFRLYSTYGFPLELTQDICHERNIHLDQSEFDCIMLKERISSKTLNRFSTVYEHIFPSNIASEFVGYHYLSYTSKIILLLQDNKLVNMINDASKESMIVLNITPFYGESGGQIGDIGYLKTGDATFKVTNTKKYGDIIIHIGIVNKGIMSVDEQVFAEVDSLRRKKISLNHTATHLLHAALLKVIGVHVTQQGSLVNDQYLRFDFAHYKSITTTQINEIEGIVNKQIWNNLSVTANNMSIESARKINAIMLAHKKYNQEVRVLRIENFSAELCGGTHAISTGEIGLFMITKEFGIGSGIRRIEALTKNEALFFIQQKKTLIEDIIKITNSNAVSVLDKIREFKLHCNKLEKEVKHFKNERELKKSLSLTKDVCYIKEISVLIKSINNNISLQSLCKITNHLRYHIKLGIIILLYNSTDQKKIHIIVNVSKDLIEFNRINALELVDYIIKDFGGKGGGRLDFAQVSVDNITTETTIIMRIHELLSSIL